MKEGFVHEKVKRKRQRKMDKNNERHAIQKRPDLLLLHVSLTPTSSHTSAGDFSISFSFFFQKATQIISLHEKQSSRKYIENLFLELRNAFILSFKVHILFQMNCKPPETFDKGDKNSQ
eukprot:gene49-27_t